MKRWRWLWLFPAVQLAGLRLEHHRWWCACGSPALWVNDTNGPHNSQHLLDPYSFTHIEHGLMFYFLAWLLRGRLGPLGRVAAALGLETAWELFENTPFIINRYRTQTISTQYFGDTVANSLGDTACCMIGYWIATKLPWKVSLALFIALELGLLLTIHDSLLRNMFTLLFGRPAA